MRRFIIITILATTLMSCQKKEFAEPPIAEECTEATITLSLQPDQSEVVDMDSRVLNPQREKYLNNAEIFCYDNRTQRCVWAYVSETDTHKFDLTVGSWDIYVIGNHETRLGSMPRSEVENLTRKIITEIDLEKYSCLPMQGRVTVEVAGDMRVPIVLTRIVAKVEVSVKVAAAMSSIIHLKSIRLVNAPGSCAYFKRNSPTSGTINYHERSCTNGSTTLFYMFENCQGTNNAIYDQKYKGRENAPANASYLHIKAETDDKLLDYYIYLGANNTTDFNVDGNKNYVVNVAINGVNETDWRVHCQIIRRSVDIYFTSATQTVYITDNYPQMPTTRGRYELDATVVMSQPSKYPVTIYFESYFYKSQTSQYEKVNNVYYSGRFPIVIPAGATTASRTGGASGWIPLGAGSSSHLYITTIEADPADKNIYTYTGGYYKHAFKSYNNY